MFEYIKSLFSKPQYQFSFVDGVVMALIILGVVFLCFAVYWLTFVTMPSIAQKISRKRVIKRLEKMKENEQDGDIR